LYLLLVRIKTEATTETTTIENSDNTAEGQLYACPMHPEVTGKQGENVLNAEWN
jgi:hypothetical protein